MARLLSKCAALVFATAVAHAASSDKSPEFTACAAKARGATYPMLHCYSQEMQAADDAVTSAYDRARKSIGDPTTKKYLTRSQTAWQQYRDAWCEATVSRSGSLARIRLLECRVAETKHRAEALDALTESR